jgi:hypothetical protein
MRYATTLLFGLTLLAACGDDPAGTGGSQDLATLKALTAPYQSFDAGKAAGWTAPFMNACFASDSGAMGVHYGNAAIDLTATPSVTRPPFLMYEPQQDGTMKLVGVEYVKAAPETDPAPVLFEQRFSFNTTLKVWTLHVWAWKTNPAGLHASWNPTVSCQFTPAQLSTMSHHH